MAYPDPYAGQYGGPPARQYSTEDFNPYEQPRYNTYDQGGPSHANNNPSYGSAPQHQAPYQQPHYGSYTDEPQSLPPREEETFANTNNVNMHRANTRLSVKSEGDRSGFDAGEFSSRKKGRSQNLWKKGSPVFRWCGCTILTFLLLVSSIVGALALWIRPPAVTIGDVQPQTVDGKIVQMSGDELVVNLGINITVNNPNYFDVDFTKIEAKLIYPINNTPIGGGNATNIVFPKGQEKEYTFPLKISYSSAIDPNSAVLIDLGKKCGLLGSKSDLEFKYEITVGIKIFFFTISPVISNSIKLACPIDPKDLTGMLGGGLGGLLGGRALRAIRGAAV